MTPVVLYALLLLAAISARGEAGNEEDDRREADQYLRRYQYMDSPWSDNLAELTHSNDSFETAVQSFQRMAGLKISGQITTETMEWMRKPRCGNPDYTGMGNIARRRRRYVVQGSRWPETLITYNFSSFTPDLPTTVIKSEIKRAFQFWTDVTPLRIVESKTKTADIEVLFGSKEHGDGIPFDGPGKVLAHAYFPQFGGDIHFDDAETWSNDSPLGINLLNVAVHELGHSLGLGHSDVPGAIMGPFYTGYNPNLTLHADDIEGIQHIYGVKTTTTEPSTTGASCSVSLGLWCDEARLDAILSIGGFLYAFRGTEYIQLDRHGIVSGYPKNISETFSGLPSYLNAALYWSKNLPSKSSNSDNGSVYFFKDSLCWLYEEQGAGTFMLVNGYPNNISNVFVGLPDKIDAAFVWSGNGKPYFIKGDKYYRSSNGKIIDVGFPRSLRAWKGLPQSIDSAFSSPLSGRTYFFKDDKFYRFNDREFKVDSGYPQKTADVWMGCSSGGRCLVDKEMDEGRDQFLPASSTRYLTTEILCISIYVLFVNIF